ncbi:hypothetical protein HOG21_05105 [bacterium]|nr:hypothetical protein [bacterium]
MKESNIKKHLIKLNNENKKLKNFSKNKYNSENKMKNSFVEILKNIKNELFLIKKSLK